MAVGIETRIFDGLNGWLAALVLSPVLRIAWPNLPFTPTGAYLRPTMLPARTDPLEVGQAGPNDYKGFYQVDVFWPIGKGVSLPMEAACAVTTHFKRGTSITREGLSFWIDDPPYLSPALQEADWFQIPVTVPYRAFAVVS